MCASRPSAWPSPWPSASSRRCPRSVPVWSLQWDVTESLTSASFALWIMVSRLQITFGEVGCCLFHLTSHCPGDGCVGPSCWRMLQHRLTARGCAPNSTSGWVVWWDVLSKRNPHSTQQNPHSTHLSKTRGSNVCSSFPSHLLYPSTVICFSCTEDIWTAKRSKHQGAVGQAGWSILGSV